MIHKPSSSVKLLWLVTTFAGIGVMSTFELATTSESAFLNARHWKHNLIEQLQDTTRLCSCSEHISTFASLFTFALLTSRFTLKPFIHLEASFTFNRSYSLFLEEKQQKFLVLYKNSALE